MEQTRHVIFIGETGSGKSSVVNLITDRNCAAVSPDAAPCTGDFTSYDVSIAGRTYRLWDTPGLNKATGLSRLFRRSSSSTTDSLKRFLQERHRCGEFDLLVLCVRGSRVNEGMTKVYKVFCGATRQIAIPVAIAITHLEKKQPAMGAWWDDNERALQNLGFIFDGYACLTCLSPHHRRRVSRHDISVLISKEYPQRTLSTLSAKEYLSDDRGCIIC